MSNKSTHIGECQACGRQQKLPGGRLSQHGYTKQWGFFQGICPGAGYLPLETSKGLIESCIANAEQNIHSIETGIKKVEAYAPVGKATIGVYVPATCGNRKSSRRTVECEIVNLPFQLEDRRQVAQFKYVLDGVNHDLYREGFLYGFSGKTVEECVEHLRAKHVESTVKRLKSEISQIRNYIRWQQQRITEWAPRPCKLIAK